MIGQQQAAADPLQLAQPNGRRANHSVRDLAQHEWPAHRHAVHRAAGQASQHQASQQATRQGCGGAQGCDEFEAVIHFRP